MIETGASAEQGFAGDRASVIVETWSRDASDERRLRGGVGLKLSLHRGPHWAVAVQGGGLFVDGAEKGVPDPDSGGPRCVGAGGEGRVMVGRAPRAAGRGPFVTVELASRAQGGCASALVDATIGYEIEHKWILLAQAFQDRGLHGSETLNVQVSAVRLRRMRGLQIGLRARLDGAEPEPAVIIGLWRRDRRGQ
ncbi:MAG: hypothetical protein KJS97_13790 [Alphaproteobacteria bacterium]|nr:hypothetical protein [Alphaproteobacteria bacterium]